MWERLKVSLHRGRKPLRYMLLKPLLQNQQLSQASLQQKQQYHLNHIIRFACQHTDYYQKRYAGLIGEKTMANISRLPILQKQDVIKNREAMLADTAERDQIKLGYTGGSTGTPVSFYVDAYKTELMRAGMMRSYMWSGWRPGQKVLNFWGAKQDIKQDSLKKRFNNFTAAEKTIHAWEYDEQKLQQWVQFIKAWQPVLIQGYASIIADVARFIVDNKIPMPSSIIGVYSTAEVLYDSQRELIQQAFHCKVTNQYGCREIPNIGLECSHGNMHVFSDMVYLESGAEEQLLITSLTNKLMPMIRYANGDTGRLKEGRCGCGSPFPMMEMGLCRSNDFIKTGSGKKIAPSYFNRLLDGVSGIRRYQFIQTGLDKLVLNVKTENELDKGLQALIQDKIQREVDAGMTFEIIQSDEIQRTSAGKYRFVISEV